MTNYLLRVVLGAVVLVAPVAVSAAETTMCTMQYQPVCGAKQVQCVTAPCYPVYHTYGNSCVLGVEKGSFIHEGECTATETGPIRPQNEQYVPPASCVAWFDGCNSCSKSSNGQAMCTLKACMNEPKAGYCTKYSDSVPSPKPPATGISVGVSPEPSLTSTTSVPELATIHPNKPGFFTRIWLSIASWFSWL